ncbi:bacterio-opsin activator HTH domain-containing protein [Halalkaliarchaeum desulfuricum]|uniref:Bacterio-opsin activator HTH domain-containing protein n=1 Tax=Halalkaliarchaeum desulfuricum TaxID=2055893 RepID=A0A343TKD9_9EURY|nr:helix-turn-helix domain-containing protein [Halalkaliarchaeum desulfuricum]AUX09561.1 bacterio-opsin activator HTH domain-containing protein [Halalkaliarchaeum desulfuricum]
MSGHGGQRDQSEENRPRTDASPDSYNNDSQITADATDAKGRHNIDPESGIHLSLQVRDRPTLQDVLRSLVQSDVQFEINRISDAGAHSSLAIVDLDALTDKQREAIELALERGYYDTPRETDLETLSDELGVSKSAVSQRLRVTESKLIQSVLAEQDEGGRSSDAE